MAGELNDNLGHDISVYAGDAAANLYIGIRRGMGAGGGYKEADSNIGQMMRDAGEPIGRRVDPAGRAIGATAQISAGVATSETGVAWPLPFTALIMRCNFHRCGNSKRRKNSSWANIRSANSINTASA